MSEASRRHFLAGGSALFGLSCTGAGKGAGGGGGGRSFTLSAGWLETELLLSPASPQPTEDTGDSGGADSASPATGCIAELTRLPVRLRAYNGQVPGPTLELNPGESISITVENGLPPYDSSAWEGEANLPHMLHSTNLHLHGMAVIPHLFAPVGTLDPSAPMIAVDPSASFSWHFDLPQDHPPGLYWYHPHLHGSTAVQVVSGMAGLIIVRGAIDEVPEIAAAREVVVALTDLGLFPGEDGVWSYLPEQNAIWDLFSSKVWRGGPQQGVEAPELLCGFSPGGYPLHLYLHNGAPYYAEQHDPDSPTTPCGTQLEVPTWQIQPGEVLRLRILNGCSDLLMPLHLEGHAMHLIALDGVNFSRPRAIQTADQQPWDGVLTYAEDARALVLGPGNRAELLIQGGEEGIYELVQLGHEGKQMMKGARKVLARLIVQGSPLDMSLPTSLPLPARHQALIEREGPFSAEREVVFEVMAPATLNRGLGVDFLINGALYDEESVPVRVKRGSHERWTLRAPPMSNGSAEGHPFHIHVNPFELDSINGLVQPEGTVMDTVWVSGGGEVVLRTHFQDWSGKTVFHCHILPHEDTGMMQNLLIEP